jgi:alkylation response protein AidB-like acyl-CoA dehydrogenase
MDLRPTVEQQLLRQSVREFAETEIGPFVRAWDEAQGFPLTLLPKLAALGLMGMQVPEADGGTGLSALDYCVALEELARVDPAIALTVAAHNGLAVAHLSMFGSAAQRAAFLRSLAAGDRLGAWALTESGSGSDAAAMRTTARRDEAGWILTGRKHFITHGRLADVLVVMAVTDVAKGAHGISAFVVERGAPGLSAGRKEDKLGMRASDTSEVILDGCRVPADALIGQEGDGFIQALKVLDAGRIGIAALAVGLAQGAHEAALTYAKERHQFGQPIAAFQAIQWKLANSATRVDAARLMTYHAAWLRDQPGTAPSPASSMAKLYASETAVHVAEECVQIHGGYGFVKDYPAEKFFRDAKLCTIGEGTSEIQRLVIARQLLGQG